MIIAVDPGLTTGVAWLGAGGVHPGSAETGPMESVKFVGQILDYALEPCLIVVEDFRPRRGAKTWQPDALHVIGALRYLAWSRGVNFELQQPGEAKRFATNEKLKRLGWRKPTPGGHEDDARRHLLLATVRRGIIPPERLSA